MNQERNIATPIQNPLLLKGTGWDLIGQMQMIRETSLESPELNVWKNKTIEKTKADLEGLYWEYLVKSDVLPFELCQLEDQIVCPKYAYKPLTEIVSSSERDGSIKKSIELIEQRLLNGDNGDTHVLISPPGWSGYESDHPTAQIYYYQKLGSEIRSMTFISRSATLSNCESLYGSLSQKAVEKNKSEKERILTLTSNLLSFKYLEPHDVVYKLEEVLGVPLPQMFSAIDNLPVIDQMVQECIKDLEVFIKYKIKDMSSQSQTEIMYKIGQTVLDMKSVLTRGRKPETKEEYQESFVAFSADDGCNGGGTIYSRGRENKTEEEEEFPNFGICAMKEACISESAGREQSLGLCMICKTCDRAFRSGKTYEEIKIMAKKSTELENKNGIYDLNLNFVALLFAAAVGAFSK